MPLDNLRHELLSVCAGRIGNSECPIRNVLRQTGETERTSRRFERFLRNACHLTSSSEVQDFDFWHNKDMKTSSLELLVADHVPLKLLLSIRGPKLSLLGLADITDLDYRCYKCLTRSCQTCLQNLNEAAM